MLQASDTDIDALVEIEENSQHRFEFFLGLNGDEPVSARTANAYAKADGPIAHSLSVFEGKMRHPAHVKQILQTLRMPGFEEARSALDLSFEDKTLADEKIAFLATLADNVKGDSVFPYEKTDGLPELRRRIAEFFRSYWRIPVTAKNFIIAPNRGELIKNTLLLYRPSTALVDHELARTLPSAWKCKNNSATGDAATNGANFDNAKGHAVLPTIFEIPKSGSQIFKLIERIRPKLVICGLAEFEWHSADAFLRLIEVTKTTGAILILDISAEFNLSSQPGNNAVLNYLSENALPGHVALLCGLVKNRVFADLEVAYLFSENETLLSALIKAAEVTYSRTPLVSQRYYDRILFDLLNFQIPRSKKGIATRFSTSFMQSVPSICEAADKCFQHNCFEADSWALNKDTVRLDYGENELPAPRLLTSAVMEAFARQSTTFSEPELNWALRGHAKQRFGIEKSGDLKVLVANGVAPLFAALVEKAQRKREIVLFPEGGYGYFEASCQFFGATTVKVETFKSDNYKLNATKLHQTLSRELGEASSTSSSQKRAWLYLNAPLVNPTGARYLKAELSAIFEVCEQFSCGVVVDTIFSGLDFSDASHPSTYFADIENYPSIQYVLLGGFSKELSGGGLRFGYALTPSFELYLSLREGLQSAPHSTVKYAALKVLQGLANPDSPLQTHLRIQASELKQRSQLLEQLLTSQGWEVLPAKGGLFLVACPTGLLGKKVVHKTDRASHLDPHINFKNLAEHIFIYSNCLMLSTSENTFRKGMDALRNFSDSLQ